ncbi:hypothetical protein E4U21_006263 [Claviceps maximensis]|nr:hypothetical protein E4U21_006263 [Claviceps maximensis]
MKMIPFMGVFLCFALASGILAGSDDASKALAMVNQARQAKGIRPLAWDAGLVAYAQYWADEMASGRRAFEHAQGPDRPSQGENLYEQSAGQCDAAYDNPMQTGMHAWLSQEHLYTGQPITTGHEPWLHWGTHNRWAEAVLKMTRPGRQLKNPGGKRHWPESDEEARKNNKINNDIYSDFKFIVLG